jgi:hypothetical protein
LGLRAINDDSALGSALFGRGLVGSDGLGGGATGPSADAEGVEGLGGGGGGLAGVAGGGGLAKLVGVGVEGPRCGGVLDALRDDDAESATEPEVGGEPCDCELESLGELLVDAEKRLAKLFGAADDNDAVAVATVAEVTAAAAAGDDNELRDNSTGNGGASLPSLACSKAMYCSMAVILVFSRCVSSGALA